MIYEYMLYINNALNKLKNIFTKMNVLDRSVDTDFGWTRELLEKKIAATMSSDEVLILYDEYSVIQEKAPLTDVENAHILNQLEAALDEHLISEYGC